MDLSLNTSVIFAAIVVLWMVWVGPQMLRRRRHAMPQPAPATTGLSSDTDAERFTMERNGHPAGMPATAPAPLAPTHEPAPFRVRKGRTALAMVGALALLAVVLGVALAAFGVVSWLLPLVSAVVVAADTAALRTLAVRDRRQKVEQAFRDAIQASSPAVIPRPTATNPSAETAPRPARDEVAPAKGTLTQGELPAAAMNDLEVQSQPAPQKSPVPPTPWQPVDLPKPTYLEAPRADRDTPPALKLPQEPKASSTPSIRKAEAAAKPEPKTDSTMKRVPDGRPATGLINLDDVLQRRRA